MDIGHETKGNMDIFELRGEMDDSDARALLDAVADRIGPNARIVVDMRGCPDVSCGGLHALLAIARQSACAGAETVLVGVRTAVADVLDTTSFSDLLHAYDTPDEAAAHWKESACETPAC